MEAPDIAVLQDSIVELEDSSFYIKTVRVEPNAARHEVGIVQATILHGNIQGDHPVQLHINPLKVTPYRSLQSPILISQPKNFPP